MTSAILLAGGRGKRMHSTTPKVLHEVAGKPLISYSLKLISKLPVDEIVVVVGYKKDIVKGAVLREADRFVKQKLNFVVQEKQLGTGNALKTALERVGNESSDLLILNGDDSLFYKPKTIRKVLAMHKNFQSDMTFITLAVDDTKGAGRIVRDAEGGVVKIVEEKAATRAQLKIREINDGCYVFKTSWLRKFIDQIPMNAVGEYYLTDLVKIGSQNGSRIQTYTLGDASEWFGVNTKEQLAQANEVIRSANKIN